MRHKLLVCSGVVLALAGAAMALPAVELAAVGDFADPHSITVLPGTVVRLAYTISGVADLHAFHNDMTIGGSVTGLSATADGTWWGDESGTAVTLEAVAGGYQRLSGEAAVPPEDAPYSFTSAGDATLAFIELTPVSEVVTIDLLSLAGGTPTPQQAWIGCAADDCSTTWDVGVDTVYSASQVTILVTNTVLGPAEETVTVEWGPGGSVARQFVFDVEVRDVEDLWTWNYRALHPTDGPGATKPTIVDVAEGGWWQYDCWPPTWYAEGPVVSGDGGAPVGGPPPMQSGSGALSRLTVEYAGCDPGQYTLGFDNVQLNTCDEALEQVVIPTVVETLTIVVEPGEPPSPDPMAWAVAPHAVSSSAVAMTATEATDNHSLQEDIEYQVKADGAEQGWQASRDYTHAGLSPNTQHTYEVQARDGVGNATDWSASVSVYTWAEAPGPGSPALDSITDASVEARWTTGANPTTTRYQIGLWLGDTASGEPDAVYGSLPGAASHACGQLAPNAQYTFQVRALNEEDVATDWVALGTVYTHAEPPSPGIPPLSSITDMSIRADWMGGSNPATTRYQVGVWEGATATGDPVMSYDSGPGETSLVCDGLEPNTQYTVQVRAFNDAPSPAATDWVLLGDRFTKAEQPGAAAIDAIAETSLRANWTGGSNPSGTTYEVECYEGTDATGSYVGGASLTGTSWVFSPLSPAVQFFCRVRAVNVPGSPTAWTGLGPRETLANPPGGGAFEPFTTTAITVSWDANGNSAHADYYVECYEGDAVGGTPVAVRGWASALSHVFTGLASGQDYTFQAMARNGEEAETAWTGLGTARTFAPPGAEPADGVTDGGVTAHWNANGNPAGSLYRAECRLGDASGAVVEQTVFEADAMSYTFAGLTPNTAYAVLAQAKQAAPGSDESDWTVLDAIVTLAAVPVALPVADPAPTSITAYWNANGNPGGTLYYAEIWRGDGFDPDDELLDWSGWIADTDFPFDGLTPNTRYSLRVRAKNDEEIPTAWTTLSTAETWTAANEPGALAVHDQPFEGGRVNPAGPASHSLSLSTIGLNGNPDTTRFAIQIGDEPDAAWLRVGNPALDPGEDARDVYARADAAGAAWLTRDEWEGKRLRGLDADTLHTFRARARNGAGAVTARVGVGECRTNCDCDVDRNGFVNALDYALIKAAILRAALVEEAWPCNVLHTDRAIDAGDLSATRARALAP